LDADFKTMSGAIAHSSDNGERRIEIDAGVIR